MAPCPPESRQSLIARLRKSAARATPWPVVSQEAARAYLAQHGHFMPEDAERIAKPGAMVLEASDVDELVRQLEARPWPLS